MGTEVINSASSKTIENKFLVIAIVLAVFLAALGIRLSLASMAQHPGRADYSFYYTVAENLVDGRGFQIDYIWHYLSRPETISHSSNDYWMPLTAVLISLSMAVFGKSIFAAVIPSIMASLLLAFVTWKLCKLYSKSSFVWIGSTCLIMFFPAMFRRSLLTDSTIFYALFAAVSLYSMIRGQVNSRWYLLAGIFAGFAHLTRQDGVCLIPILIFITMTGNLTFQKKCLSLASVLVLYGVVLFPLLVSNYAEFGTIMPLGSSKTMFLTTYEDIYSFGKELSLQSYLQWGTGNIVASKLRMARLGLIIMYMTLGPILSILIGAGLIRFMVSKNKGQNIYQYLPPVLFALILWGFYTLVATFPGSQGGLQRSILAVSPFLIILAVTTIEKLIPTKRLAILVIIFVFLMSAYQSVLSSRKFIVSNINLAQDLTSVKRIIEYDSRDRDLTGEVVIMTRNPWQVYHTTRFKAIQIPNDDLEIIYDVAKMYGANYLILPAPRAAFIPIAQGTVQDERFQRVRVSTGSWMQLYRIE